MEKLALECEKWVNVSKFNFKKRATVKNTKFIRNKIIIIYEMLG